MAPQLRHGFGSGQHRPLQRLAAGLDGGGRVRPVAVAAMKKRNGRGKSLTLAEAFGVRSVRGRPICLGPGASIRRFGGWGARTADCGCRATTLYAAGGRADRGGVLRGGAPGRQRGGLRNVDAGQRPYMRAAGRGVSRWDSCVAAGPVARAVGRWEYGPPSNDPICGRPPGRVAVGLLRGGRPGGRSGGPVDTAPRATTLYAAGGPGRVAAGVVRGGRPGGRSGGPVDTDPEQRPYMRPASRAGCIAAGVLRGGPPGGQGGGLRHTDPRATTLYAAGGLGRANRGGRWARRPWLACRCCTRASLHQPCAT